MSNRIDTNAGRKALKPRREPYWYRVSAGEYLGFRKLDEGAGTWIARWRGDDGKQHYHAIGQHDNFDAAKKDASAWFAQCGDGSPDVLTVEAVCRLYVEDRRREKGSNTANDAEGRFKRHIYGKPIGRIELPKLKTGDVKVWLHGLIATGEDVEEDPDAERRSKDSANRDLGNFKAALNFGYRHGYCTLTAAWDRVESFHKVAQRRERFLSIAERRTLIAAASPELTRLIKALLLTAARPGEIADAKVGDLNPAGLLTLSGKTGRRTIPISPDAEKHLRECAGDRGTDLPLVARDYGQAWDRFAWRDGMQEARVRGNLPDDVVLYNLRHAAISEMCVGGIDLLTVARIAGTSIAMIQLHYGHLLKEQFLDKLAVVKMM